MILMIIICISISFYHITKMKILSFQLYISMKIIISASYSLIVMLKNELLISFILKIGILAQIFYWSQIDKMCELDKMEVPSF